MPQPFHWLDTIEPEPPPGSGMPPPPAVPAVPEEPGFMPPSEADLSSILGPDPRESFPPFEEEQMPLSTVQKLLVGLARGTEGARFPRPRGFGGHFGAGLVSGLAGAGRQIATAQERFLRRQDQRRLQYDEARRQATADYVKAHRDEISKGYADYRARKEKVAEEERRAARENVRITDDEVASFPELERYRGRTISRNLYEETISGRVGRAEAAADRQARALEIQSANMERALRTEQRAIDLARINNFENLVVQYRMDPHIKAYTEVRMHYEIAKRAASKQNGIGDHALIFAYMRAREPQNPNAVREGEFDTASKAVGALQGLAAKATLRRFLRGDILMPEGRELILDMLRSDVDAWQPWFDLASGQFVRRANMIGIDNPEELFMRSGVPTESPAPRPAPRPAPSGAGRADQHRRLQALRDSVGVE